MKKIKYLIFLLLLGIISVQSVDAASLKVSANKSTVVVGSSVSVTVSVNGSDAAGWEYCLNYDTSMFSLTSHSSPCILGGTLAGNKSVTFKLKSKKSGSTTISLKDADILNDAANSVLTAKGSVTIKAKTQAEIEASYSTNANLSGLRVVDYNITPDFDKDTLEYSLEVENNVDKITIRASKADNSATISGTGEKELTEGINKFNIVVTAEKGNKKTYVIEVNRKELNPINVSVDGKEYTLVRKTDVLEAPSYYSSTEVEIQGELVPAFKSDITKYVLVGLKDSDGNIALYRYDESNSEYVLYNQISFEGLVIIPLENNEIVKGYETKKEFSVSNVTINGFVKDVNSEFALIYGMNASTGVSGWYKYDTKESTLQRYEEVKGEVVSSEEKDLYFIIAITFAVLSGVTILLVIVLLAMNSKLRRKNKKLIAMLEHSKTVNVVVDEEEIVEEKEEVQEPAVKPIVNNEPTEVIVEEAKEETQSLSQRELRRLEKQKEHEQREELRKMQEDFLMTVENEIVTDDVELEETTPVKKSKKKKKRK